MKVKILVVYYSLFGHTYKMAQAVVDGIKSIAGGEAVLRRADDFDVVKKFINGDKTARDVLNQQKDIPVCTPDDFRAADGFIFGSPTRFGNMCAQMKQIFDSCSPLWQEGVFEGKPAGVFTSTGSTHGGQETTLLTMMVPILHLGMIIVGVPYSTAGMLHAEARGGTPYGPSTIAGSKGELYPVAQDLDIARFLGRRVAQIAEKLQVKKTA